MTEGFHPGKWHVKAEEQKSLTGKACNYCDG